MNPDFYRVYIMYFLIFSLACLTLFLACRIEKTNLSKGNIVFIDGKTYQLTLVVNENQCNYFHFKQIEKN